MNSDFLKATWNDLMLHKLRALLSTLGVLFGVAALVAMLSVGEGAKKEVLEQIKQLGMHNIIIKQTDPIEFMRSNLQRPFSYLTVQDGNFLKETLPQIELVLPIVHEKNLRIVDLPQVSAEVISTTKDYITLHPLPLFQGRFLSDLDNKEHLNVCVLGFELAKALGKMGRVGKYLRIGKHLYQIIGILAPKKSAGQKSGMIASRNENLSVFLPMRLTNSSTQSIESSPIKVHELIFKVYPHYDVEQIVPLIKRGLKLRHQGGSDYQIIVPLELKQQVQKTQSTFNLILGSIAAISLLVGGIGIMNVMLATISERTREIGLRRALGATQNDIIWQFLLETLFLTTIGAVLGLALGLFLSWIISMIGEWKAVVTVWSIILSIAMALIVGLFSGLWPAIKASKMDPIQALRKT